MEVVSLPSFRCSDFGAYFFLVSIVLWILWDQNYSLNNFIVFIVYLVNCITLILFTHLIKHWPRIIETWEHNVSSNLQQESIQLGQQLNLRLLVIASSSLSRMSFIITFNQIVNRETFQSSTRFRLLQRYLKSCTVNQSIWQKSYTSTVTLIFLIL